MGASILSDGVCNPFSVRPVADDDLIGVLCFVETPVLRFVFLPYYWRYEFSLVPMN